MKEVKVETKKKIVHEHKDHIKIFVVNVDNKALQSGDKKSFERNLCGLPMSEVLVHEFEGHDICFLNCKFGDEDKILSELKNGSLFCSSVAVLFSDQPCLTKFVIENALMSEHNLISFGRSFVAKTDFLKKLDCLCCLEEFEREPLPEFVVVNSEEKFLIAERIINERICNNHIKNGVNVENSIIEFGAEIDAGAQIFDSSILGNSNLGLCLVDGSSVIDSIVASGVKVESSILKNCIIGANIKNKKLENTTFMGDNK